MWSKKNSPYLLNDPYIYNIYISFLYAYIYIFIYTQVSCCQVSYGCRIQQLHHCRGVRLPQRVSYIYDTKQPDVEFPVMQELWGLWSTPLLPSLSGLLWPGVVAPDRVQSMGQIELNWTFAKLNHSSTIKLFSEKTAKIKFFTLTQSRQMWRKLS